jgi:hypothetical protein
MFGPDLDPMKIDILESFLGQTSFVNALESRSQISYIGQFLAKIWYKIYKGLDPYPASLKVRSFISET